MTFSRQSTGRAGGPTRANNRQNDPAEAECELTLDGMEVGAQNWPKSLCVRVAASVRAISREVVQVLYDKAKTNKACERACLSGCVCEREKASVAAHA
eukprot:2425415-Pleurochrysis_carterae.AAC.6